VRPAIVMSADASSRDANTNERNAMTARILIVDDDRDTCTFIESLLAGAGREIVSASDPGGAIARIREDRFDLLISDINLNAGQTGLDVLRAFKAQHAAGQVVLISGFGTLETAIEAMRSGAFDYISKPFDIAEIKRTVERALTQAARVDEPQAPVQAGARSGLIGRSAPMLDVYKLIARAADSSSTVLIIGESGTGKELVARAIHHNSNRAKEPFVAINCSAVVETLLESELFGHVRGAFTGAVSDHPGIFAQAGNGTVLLDEIGETTHALQVRLLRVLEEGEVRPVGGSRANRMNARVIAATNIDLEQAAAAGRFRQDLYYRLSVLVIRIPPLRERRADLPLLIHHFLQEACTRAGRRRSLSSDSVEALMRYPWPGNVRELRNMLERLAMIGQGTVIEASDLPPTVTAPRETPQEGPFSDLPTLDELERRYLVHVLAAVNGNRTRAAETLGVDRRTLYRMAERFKIELKD
jgi:DNA-binding NtrC family response regulator